MRDFFAPTWLPDAAQVSRYAAALPPYKQAIIERRREALRLAGAKGGYPKQARSGRIEACARCGHGRGVHKKTRGRYQIDLKNSAGKGSCLDCACEKWWGGVCYRCNDYCYRQGGCCAKCYREIAVEKELRAIAYHNSPEVVAERQRKEEAKWIRQGRNTLRALRRHLAQR